MIALVSFALGQNDQGFEWLERGCKEHDPWLRLLKIAPELAAARSSPRYPALLRKVGLED